MVLANDPLLLLGWCSFRRREDEISCPPQRDRLRRQTEGGHHELDVLREEVVCQVREQLLIRAVVRVNRSRPTDLGAFQMSGFENKNRTKSNKLLVHKSLNMFRVAVLTPEEDYHVQKYENIYLARSQ